MSLFVINRYGEKTGSKENENVHLANLLQKIEERKKQRSILGTENTPSKQKQKHCSSTNVENHNKSKKDENIVKSNSQNVNIEVVNNTDETPITNEISNSTEKESKTDHNFPILGVEFKKKPKYIDRVLPYWLAHPKVISTDLNSGPNLDELNFPLDPKLINILKTNGVSKLFPVQENIISWLLKCNNDRKIGYWPRDTCVSAPTGSGKTLAYILPIIQQLQSRLVPRIRCLIVLPVQELATQVYKVAFMYSQHTNLEIRLLTGASSFEVEQASLMKKYEKKLSSPEVDIIVATPGRLVDHILKTPGFSLDALQFLVIDEADRTADWIQYLPNINSHTSPFIFAKKYSRDKPPVQKLLFSATLSQDPEKLNQLGLFQPILFTTVGESEKQKHLNANSIDFIGRYTSPEELIERAIECSTELKPIALYHILTREMPNEKTLIFTNSGETSHRLALLIQSLLGNKNNSVGEISSQLVPKQREDVLKKFDNGEIQILVSSDALARGLDIPNVTLVISYDLPKHIKGYIHRSGRTGRAGKSGTAISIITLDQIEIFQKLLTGAHKTVPVHEKIDDLQDLANEIDYEKHVGILKNILEKEKDQAIKRLKTAKRKRLNSL